MLGRESDGEAQAENGVSVAPKEVLHVSEVEREVEREPEVVK